MLTQCHRYIKRTHTLRTHRIPNFRLSILLGTSSTDLSQLYCVMEKQHKQKNKILKALPKVVAAVRVTFQNPPFRPGRDHKSKPVKGFSGPIVSMIPDEAPRKPNNNIGTENYYQQEDPTSPKISCMGQIKHKKKQIKKAKATKSNVTTNSKDTDAKKRHVSAFQRVLLKPKKSEGRRKSDASAAHVDDDKDALANRAPHVTQMKRFASGRDTLANFDWKAHVEQEEIDLDYSSDGERVVSDGEEEDEVMIPFSAPILVSGGGGGFYGSELNLKPRKEINLWKRRTMAPPRPLQLVN